MKNPYLVRTAAVASLAAAVLAAGWMGMPSDEMQIAPESVAVSGTQVEPAMHFHAGFVLQANLDEPEAYEYY
jgi:hypothetical protein